ncbi:PIN domain-like protein, partial [Cerioporus squamosus]
MGVPGLWDILRPAGNLRSLTHLSVKDGFEANPDGKRGFRVGIDASIWFYHATYGREGENPELRTLFFRCTRLMTMPFLPLFVFDGPKRPEIKRGKRVSGKNHWMVQGMQEIISAFGFEWRMAIAPGEAEAELAYLNRIGVIDAVLSDDVDTFLFGAKMVVRNPSTTLSGNRSHSLKNAAGKDDGNHVMTYKSSDLLSHDDIQLTQEGMILIGVLRGGDYSDGLHGCGVATAHGLAKAGFGEKLVRAARTLSRDALGDFLVEWRREIQHELRTNSSGKLGRKSPSLAKAITEEFPSIDVVLAYTNPITSEAKGPGHKNAAVDWDKEPDLGRIAGLCEMYFEWGVKHIIIKRFRTVLWPSAVLRILRRAAIIKDRKAAAFMLRPRNPETPRKNGKERRVPPGTPSRMITEHFARITLNTPRRDPESECDSDDEAEDGERLIVKIHSSRRHASTDNVLEYRLEIAPAQLVRLCEAGIKGLRHEVPPDLSDSDDDGDDDDGEGKKGGKKTKKPPPDPESHLRIWLPASMVEIVEPDMVEEFEGEQQKKAEKKAAKGAKGACSKKSAAGTAATAKSKKTKAPVLEEEEEES